MLDAFGVKEGDVYDRYNINTHGIAIDLNSTKKDPRLKGPKP